MTSASADFQALIESSIRSDQPRAQQSADDQLALALEASLRDAEVVRTRQREESNQQVAEAVEVSQRDAEASVRKREVDERSQIEAAVEMSRQHAAAAAAALRDEEKRQLQAVLALSSAEPPPRTPPLADDVDEIEKAIQASLKEQQEAEGRKKERHRREDESDIFQAALRASRVDLGPRGISQAAKIFATGDTSLGQANVVKTLNSHQGAGGRFTRSPSTAGVGSAASPASVKQSSGTNVARNSVALRDAGKSVAKGAGAAPLDASRSRAASSGRSSPAAGVRAPGRSSTMM